LTENIRVVDLTAKSPMEIESILKSEERRGWHVRTNFYVRSESCVSKMQT